MSRVKTGIYLEKKKATIGTGSTSQEQEYRNFWMVLSETETHVICVLLDDDFKLTGLNETFSLDAFLSERFTFIPQGEKRYQRLLRELLEKKQKQAEKSKSKAPTSSPDKKAPAKGGNWWEGESRDISTEDLFSTRAAEKNQPSSQPKTGGNWWEGGSERQITTEELFSTRAGSDSESESEKKPKSASQKKKKQSGVKLKKTWWDR